MRRLAALLGAALAFAMATAAAAPPLLSQYEHRAWSGQDGSIKNPADIAQTRDGALWIGTDTGLVRFDGVRFVPHNQFGDASVARWHISAVHGARDGSLWLGANGQLGHVVDGRLRQWEIAGSVNTFQEDKDGVVWFTVSTVVGASTPPLCSVSDEVLRCVGKPTIPYPIVGALRVDPDGSLWMGSDQGVCHWSPRWPAGRPADCALREMLGPTYGQVGIGDLQRARKDGALWLGIPDEGHAFGLGRLIGDRWTPWVTSALDGGTLDVNELMEDADGTLWVGTRGSGIYRVQDGRVDHFDKRDGLTDNFVYNLFEDREGTVWAVTAIGLDAFRKLPVATFAVREGLPGNETSAVLPARDGGVWVGSHHLTLLRDDRVSPQALPPLLRNGTPHGLFEDHLGRLWAGVDGELVVLDQGVARRITDAQGRQTGPVHMLVEDAAHDVWALTMDGERGLLRIRDFVYEEVLTDRRPRIVAADPLGGLWLALPDSSFGRFREGRIDAASVDHVDSKRIRSLRAEADGTLFVATSDGLLIKRGGRRHWLDVDHGLPCGIVLSVLRDARQSAWLLLECGILQITDADLEAWLSHPEGRIRSRLLDASDGFQAGISGIMPRAAVAPDGRLWFTNSKVVQVVDPAALVAVRKPVPVQIEAFLADRQAYLKGDHKKDQPDAALTLPPHTRDIEIRYSALSYVLPHKIKFRYRLEGRDDAKAGWTDADTRREVFYSDLPPGSYRFRVMASNSEGVWNEAGASVAFEVHPAFFQTTWFLVLCIALGAASMYLVYVIRMRQLARRYRDRLAAQNDERERIARELHDTLLQGIQGLVLRFQAVNERIPPGAPARAMMEATLDGADKVLIDGRRRLLDLRADDGQPLARALAEAGEAMTVVSSVSFRMVEEGAVREPRPEVGDAFLRIGIEAIANAFKHARARSIDVTLSHGDDRLALCVSDDGIGMDAELLAAGQRPGHWGLTGMRERAAQIGAALTLSSNPGGGTQLALTLAAVEAYPDDGKPRR